MQFTITVYDDFKAMFTALGFGVVFYHDGGGSDFQITAITSNGVAIRANSFGAKPASFDTDFPQAVALSIDMTFG